MQVTEEGFKQALVELRKLRRDVDAAESRFFRAARDFEVKYKTLWQAHYASFDMVFEEECLGSAARYREFLAAEKVVGPANVDAMGVPATLQAARIMDAGRRGAYIEAAITRAATVGVPWSVEQAKKSRLEIVGQPARDLSWNGKEDREKQLHAENVALKKENLQLKRDVKERDGEIARLQKRLARAVPQKKAS